ncbi:asparagine synthase-related protein [Pseudomonas sp. A34-9]|uniref:asparagine synthase-related protein n=1 Tax=Pseudomonas sp. A34-9 TaxID=3034675 RepID=UPI00240CFB23|nr:asparagine synthase-related protein [Pseudomonas sp. A34-9]
MNNKGKRNQTRNRNSAQQHSTAEKIVHVNPLSSCKLIVIDNSSGSIMSGKFEQSIFNKEPDRFQIIRQLTQDDPVSTATYWQGLIMLPPSHTYTYDTKLKTSTIETNLTHFQDQPLFANQDPFELIIDYIAKEHNKNNYRKLVVRFSGGVDSTCLLLAAIEVAGKDHVTAITWFDEKSSANNDRNTATVLCNTLDVNHILFKLEPEDFFQDVNPADHFHINSSMASEQVFKKERDFIFSQLGDEYIVLDGHGGDHLFLDPVPVVAFQHLIREKRFFKGFNIAATISKLTGSNLYQTLTQNRRQRNNETDQLSYFFNSQFLPRRGAEKPKSLAEEHVQAIAQAVFQNAISSTLNKFANIIYPFTSQKIIEYALTQDPYSMFDENETRLPIKRAFRKKHPNILLRRDKGHIKGAYQKALKFHQKNIISKLRSSWMSRENIINMPNIENSINRSAMGFGGIEKYLLQIICASLIKNT